MAMMVVMVLPPRESWRILVNLLSLYGMWPALEVKAVMTRPRARREVLMLPKIKRLSFNCQKFTLTLSIKHYLPASRAL